MPPDELPLGVPSDAEGPRPEDFDKRGKFAPGNRLARAGGQARAGKTRLAERLGLQGAVSTEAFRPYKAMAASYRKARCSELAATVGGGFCGTGPSSFVASAALQLAWSRYFSDLAAAGGNPALAVTASRLANDSRQNILAAHELCAREAEARAKSRSRANPVEAMRARILASGKAP